MAQLGLRVGAGVAVVSGEQVLLIRRHDNGCWDLPGGGVNAGERVEAAACRELSEETGLRLDANNVTLLGVFSGPEHRHTYPDGNTVDWVTVVYRATLDQAGELRAGDDAAEARFWPLDDLPGPMSGAAPFYLRTLFQAQGASFE